jgi:membrane-bound lytic murein transglycosylase MltF
LKEKYIRFLTSKNTFDYFVYQGRQRGFQYEMAKAFVKHLNKKYLRKSKLKIQFEMIPLDYDQMFSYLEEGKGDVIAAGLTILESRKKRFAFTVPYRKVKEAIVTSSKYPKAKEKSFYVRRSSSYYQRLQQYNKMNPKGKVSIETVDERLDTEYVLELVSRGRYPKTLADDYLAEWASKVFGNLTIQKENPFGRTSSIAWGVRYESSELLKELNTFIATFKKGTLMGNILDKRYFKSLGKVTLDNSNRGVLSPYDKLIKKYAKKYNWDWRLLAALAFQESRFNPNIVNKWGAIGLFQVKQMTANEPYVNIRKIRGKNYIENNIHAGVKYLSWIRERYYSNRKGMRPKDQLRMSMAAYNAGPATVMRARKKAKRMGLDPNRWFRNVELALLSMKKVEPVNYVSEINKRYLSYLLLGYK